MRRFLPPVVLVMMAFLVAELLPGSAPITQPALWPFLLLIYGPGALLIREAVRRRQRGWESALLLGAAYGLVEEGLALQSLFNPTLYGAANWGGRIFGINAVYAEAAIIIHAVWSAAVPIVLTDLIFPSRRDTPYLGRIGLALTAIWYILGVSLLGLLTRFSIAPGYWAPAMVLAVTAMMTLVVAVLALVVMPRNVTRPKLHTNAPRPWAVLLITCIASLTWHGLLALLWRIQPAFADWPLVLIPMLGAMFLVVMMAWLLRRWAATRAWNDRHSLALVSGALVSHSLIGGAILTSTTVDRVGVAGLGLVLIAWLLLFARRVRDRVQSLSMQESDEPPITNQVMGPIGHPRRKGSYGIDAPQLLPVLGLLIVANVVSGVLSASLWPFVGALVVVVCALCGLYTSRRGKFVVWAELLEQLKLRGDEHILDLGCGRGAVLFLAAQHLTTGRAFGVDIWQRGDQSGNSAEATWHNAETEGVAERVELHTADMTALPFQDNSFDLVLSNVAIHNIKTRAGRAKAIKEAVRVLRPGGRLLIADLWATRLYCAVLTRLGMADVARTNVGWRMWWSGPWLPTRLVRASKNGAAESSSSFGGRAGT